MIWVHTLFDYSKHPAKPLVTGILKDDKLTVIPLYINGTGETLLNVKKKLAIVAKLIASNETVINDYKSHIMTFPISPSKSVLCVPTKQFTDSLLNIETAHNILNDILKPVKPELWNLTLAEAHSVYAALEKRGLSDGVDKLEPIYSTDTFSGRSKTTGFNIQGTNADSIVKHSNQQYDWFVNFDWIAADIRVASILSNDKAMLNSFIKSDPYETMAKDLGLTRDECKQPFLATIYSLDADNQILDYYPTFKNWMKECIDKMHQQGYLTSILGRKFHTGEIDRTDKSVFNAVIQGSVAHATQRAIARLHEIFPEFLVTEVHDSIVLACDRSSVSVVIEEGIKVMTKPLQGVVFTPCTFPTRVSIGREWRKWQFVKEAR